MAAPRTCIYATTLALGLPSDYAQQMELHGFRGKNKGPFVRALRAAGQGGKKPRA